MRTHSPKSNIEQRKNKISSHARNVPLPFLYIAYIYLFLACLMKVSDFVLRSTWSSVWHIAPLADSLGNARTRRHSRVSLAGWQETMTQPNSNLSSKPEETRGWESRYYRCRFSSLPFFFFRSGPLVLCAIRPNTPYSTSATILWISQSL